MGYTGGLNPRPTYESVCGGDGHTEAIRIEYDPEQVTYETLLKEFYTGHRPSPAKVQYKSAVWVHSDEQKDIVEKSLQEKGEAWVDVEVAKDWYDAEQYHQKYYSKGVSCNQQ